jgi:glutaconate CoA-transferase subunit B
MPLSTNEVRAGRRAMAFCDITDIFLYQQRGYIDYGLLGAAQIDQYGNINTSVIGDFHRPKVRFPGSGGANDIASSSTRVLITLIHEKRRFVEKVDFVTSPGYLTGNNSRMNSGLIFGGPFKVITDLGIMGFDQKSKRLKVEAIQSDATIQQIRENTGFELLVADSFEKIEAPREDELRILREIDPEKVMLRGN